MTCKAAVAYLQRRPDVERGRIGGLGLSVGGELMIEAAASTPGLKAVASEGAGIRSIREMLDMPGTRRSGRWRRSRRSRPPRSPSFYNQTPPPNLTGLVAKVAPRPLLLMYSGTRPGRRDRAQPGLPPRGRRVATLWEIPGAGHVGGIRAQPAEYERRVVGFFDAALR